MERSDLPAMFYGAKPEIFALAKELRKNMTVAEKMLWRKLNKSQLGVRFKAQHPIDIFIADFYCHRYKLVVEVDGDIHKYQQEYDEGRTAELEYLGITVIRFQNSNVINNLEEVVNEIKSFLVSHPPDEND